MDEIERIVSRELVISTAEHPGLATTIRRRARSGQLAALLPGIYAAADRAMDFLTRVRAVAVRVPHAVITGDAAARLTFQPDRRVSVIDVASHSRPPERAWLRSSRREVPADHVVMLGPVRLTDPALTAVELAVSDGGDAVDAALRTGAVTLAQLTEALDACAGRTGARTRRLVVARSRSNPWSPAERRLHELLDEAGITGWSANRPLRIAGRVLVPDVYLSGGVVIEVDGRGYHASAEAFERDRARQNLLALRGLIVLRFTWSMIQHQPDLVIGQVLAALALAGRKAARHLALSSRGQLT